MAAAGVPAPSLVLDWTGLYNRWVLNPMNTRWLAHNGGAWNGHVGPPPPWAYERACVCPAARASGPKWWLWVKDKSAKLRVALRKLRTADTSLTDHWREIAEEYQAIMPEMVAGVPRWTGDTASNILSQFCFVQMFEMGQLGILDLVDVDAIRALVDSEHLDAILGTVYAVLLRKAGRLRRKFTTAKGAKVRHPGFCIQFSTA